MGPLSASIIVLREKSMFWAEGMGGNGGMIGDEAKY